MHKQTSIILVLVILALVAFAGKWYIDSRSSTAAVNKVSTNPMNNEVDMGDGNADKTLYSNDLYKFAIDFPSTYDGVTVVGKPGERGDYVAHLYFLWAPGSKDQEELGSVKIYTKEFWDKNSATMDQAGVVLTTDQYVFEFGGVQAVQDNINAGMMVGKEQLQSWIRAIK